MNSAVSPLPESRGLCCPQLPGSSLFVDPVPGQRLRRTVCLGLAVRAVCSCT